MIEMMKKQKFWKAHYAQERNQRRRELVDIVRASWEEPMIDAEDTEVIKVLKNNGILSFPHTYLDDSLEAVLRTVNSLYKTQKEKVIALGVLHGNSESSEDEEFSLDTFEDIVRLYASVNQLKPIKIKKLYPPRKETGKSYIQTLKEAGESLRAEVDNKTAVVMTGDISHYGYGYLTDEEKQAGRIIDEEGYQNLIENWINEGLDLVYHKKDYEEFLRKQWNSEVKNDQVAVAIMASAFLGENLDCKMMSKHVKLSDYSKIVPPHKKPTVVASVFYGVTNKEIKMTQLIKLKNGKELHLEKIDDPKFDINTFRNRYETYCLFDHNELEKHCDVVEDPSEFERILTANNIKKIHSAWGSCIDTKKNNEYGGTASVHYFTTDGTSHAIALYRYTIERNDWFLDE